MTTGRASSRVWRIFSPPGTSPTPVRPALSVMTTRLRVKNGPWAPLRLSSMLSRPATGITRIPATFGAPRTAPADKAASAMARTAGLLERDLADLDHLLPALKFLRLERRHLLGLVGHDLEAEVLHPLARFGVVERRDDGLIELLLHVCGQSLRTGHRLPRIDVDALHT